MRDELTMSYRWQTDASPVAVEKITAIGLKRSPREACGVILPTSWVAEVPNRSEEEGMYEVRPDDVAEAVSVWVSDHSKEPSRGLLDFPPGWDFIIWHTHPNGFVGPSRQDLVARRTLYPDDNPEIKIRFLVVALPGGEAALF